MSKSPKPEFMKAANFLAHLSATVEALPTGAEKSEAIARIEALVDFLAGLRSAITSIPTIEDAADVKQALDWLKPLIAKAEANPVLAGLAGGSRSGRSRNGHRRDRTPDLNGARQALESLESLPIEELRERLLDEHGFSLSVLRGVASSLGISGVAKLPRDSLAHQIATKIANYRGYKALSGQSEGDPAASKAS